MMKHIAIAVFLAGLAAGARALPAAPATQPADLFDTAQPVSLHIRLTAEEWRRMHPQSRPRFAPRNTGDAPEAPTTQPATRPIEENSVISPYGYVFRSVPAKVEIGQDPPVDCAVRFKGNYTYSMSAGGPRRPMKIEFDRPDPNRRVRGVATINLNVAPADRSRVREHMAFGSFREAGLPAPRTVFALVYLTVEGKYDREYLGLCTLVEQVDEAFFRRWYGDGSGMALKPEMLRGLPYLGRDWAAYRDRFGPKGAEDSGSTQAFIGLLRLVHFAGDEEFRARIGTFIDVDAFLRFIAVQAMIVNTDSFLTTGHNYYLYRSPRDGRFRWSPWDMDLSFGNFNSVASVEQQAMLSVLRPQVPPNRLIERMLTVEPFASAYRKQARELVEGPLSPARFEARFAALRPILDAADAACRAAGRVNSPTTQPAHGMELPLEQFMRQRLSSVRAQLDGGQEGFVPATSRHLLLRGSWDEHRRESAEQSAGTAARMLIGRDAKGIAAAELVAAAQARFAAVAPGGSCTPAELAEAMALALPVPMHYVFDPGPGIVWSRVAFKLADANGDGKMTAEEFAAAVAKLIAEADRDKDGKLTWREARAALEQLAAGL